MTITINNQGYDPWILPGRSHPAGRVRCGRRGASPLPHQAAGRAERGAAGGAAAGGATAGGAAKEAATQCLAGGMGMLF